MTLFNSLGSNYTFRFAVASLFAKRLDNEEKLKTFLENRYQGQAYLLYKGRQALRLALQVIDNRESVVGICGFTCFAVFDAVNKEGYRHKYLDIDATLNFTYEIFLQAVKQEPKLKILIIQNTLGYPADMKRIKNYAREHGILIIEDLAHCVGSVYDTGQEAGTVGDFTALSFSQDKMIDGISGGALVVRNKKYQIQNQTLRLVSVAKRTQQQDRLYPLLTFLIRKTYASGLGRVLHVLFKKANMLTMPMGKAKTSDLQALPGWYCALIHDSFKGLDYDLSHRRQIAGFYAKHLDQRIVDKLFCEKIQTGANLRFPVFVKDKIKLIHHLKKKGLYIADTWYDTPIAPRRYLADTDYKHQCPNSEKITGVILNLPTHKQVTVQMASELCDTINEYIQSIYD